MSKYNFELDMSTENSNAVILKNIQPHSKVLEVGCAHGRMTKYLKEQLNCELYIVEVDEEAGKVASQWASESFLGKRNGDIESSSVFCALSALDINQLDYIIFADVLEHLYNPQKVLESVKHLLNSNGSIWISIPNISHNAVLIDLWNDNFEYRPTGLLDNTHIRFFTEKTLYHMIDSAGFKINKKCNLPNAVENTEFGNSYNNVPLEVQAAMRERRNAETYQFVWELKVK